jgi:YHS domain-containing protein
MAQKAQEKVKCPVCGMLVQANCCGGLVSQKHGKNYHFCSKACEREFDRKISGKGKGWFGNWLDRMDKANREAFGCSGPKCH